MSLVTLRKVVAETPIFEIMKVREFLKKLHHYEENGFSWPKSLMDATNIDDLRSRMEEFTKESTVVDPTGKTVPTQEHFWVESQDEEIVGIVRVRPVLTPEALHCRGHISYGIAKEYRGKGYAKAALRMAIDYCCDCHGLTDILLTTYSNNAPSWHIIESMGGKKWDTVVIPGRPGTVRYWLKA